MRRCRRVSVDGMSAPASRRPPPRRPPRRLPARVYWFRRLLVLGIAVALVWGVTALVGGGDDAKQAAATQDSPEPEPTTTTPPPTSPPTRGGHQYADGRPRVVSTGLADAQGGCLPEDVRVVPAVARGATGGEDVTVQLSLATAGSTPCRIEVDAELLLLQVSTGGSPVWNTEQCPGAVPERTVVLRPGWTSALDVVWPGIYGDKGCTGTTKDAPPGSYAVEAAVYEGEPSRADFDLAAALPPDDEADGPGGGNGSDDGDETGEGSSDADEGSGGTEEGSGGGTGGGAQGGVDYGGEDDASTGNHAGDPQGQ